MNRFAPSIEARSQVLHYRIPVVGTGMSLNYASDRVPGRRVANQIRIPLNSARLPHDVEEIALEISAGDQQFSQRFPSEQASYTYTWEPPAGSARESRAELVTVRIGQVHRAAWPRPERIVWKEHQAAVGLWDSRRHGLGGWTLTPYHAFDTVAGILYLGNGTRRQIPRPGDLESADGLRIPSEDTSEVYQFDTDGRHSRTLDGLTGGDRWVFELDGDGHLHSLGPPGATLCQIERGGTAIGLQAPGDAHTSLTLDEAGYLRSVTDPAGARIEVHHGPDGLLAEVVDPRGNAYRFAYDELGRLTSEQRPDGGGSVLSRTTTADGFSVRRSTATGLEFVYGLERLPGGVTKRVTGCCVGGGQTISVERPDGSRVFTYPDGSGLELKEQPDPRFGVTAPLLAKLVRRTPAGLAGQLTLTHEDSTDQVELNGRALVARFDIGERQVAYTSAEGRTSTATFDSRGALRGAESPGFAPLQVERDPAGRMVGASFGSRRIAIHRDERGRPAEIELGADRVTRLEFDGAERVVSSVSPGLRRSAFDFDAAGNLIAFTTPGESTHRFMYGPTNAWTAHELPTGERYESHRDADGRPTIRRLPSGREVLTEYDEAGRPRAVKSPEAVVALQFDVGGRLNGAVRTTESAGAQELALAHDGPLVTGVDWRGPLTASVRYAYDSDLNVASIGLIEATERRIARDRDGFIIGIGPFSVSRDGPGGAVSAITHDRMTVRYTFDDSGRIAERIHELAGSVFYGLRVARDGAVGVRGREEVIDGATIARTYEHDADGQLVTVVTDGATREMYAYDRTGNRVRHDTRGGGVSASYDAADRLLALGEMPREIDADGHLRRRGNLTFTYGARGELLRVETADGASVGYTYDGLGRLVARTDGSGTEGYVHNHLAPFPELLASRSPNGSLTVFYFDDGGNLYALMRDGSWFYVACDEVGSPRIVVDANGATVKVIDRDAFGVVLADSNPGFDLCIGFAGGLLDPLTGLIRFGRRDYEPEAGRWTGPDPIGFGGGNNLYRYVWNNPVGIRDPSGTQGSGRPLWDRPYQHVSPLDPVFHPEPTPIDDPAWPYDRGPQQWENPRTDTFPISPPGDSFFDKFAGSEPDPTERIAPGWDWRRSPQNYGYRGDLCDWQVGVGGIGAPGSEYPIPGAEPGSPEPGPGDAGISVTFEF